jgi:hypothetical protein
MLPTTPKDLTLTFISINEGGILLLSDGTSWRIAPGDLPRVMYWTVGNEVLVQPNLITAPVWPNLVTEFQSGVFLRAMPQVPRPRVRFF